MKRTLIAGRKLPVSHWAVRSERAFKKSVADAINRHHKAGRPVYYGVGGTILQWRPDGQTKRLGKTGKSTRVVR